VTEQATERIARAGLHVGVCGCAVVAFLLVATGVQQIFFPMADPAQLQLIACVMGLDLGMALERALD
jgi:hypothetical protein